MRNLSQDVLKRMKTSLQAAFGKRLHGVVLYGSEARCEAGEDSDIDLLVLLADPVDRQEDSWTCIRALYPLVLELDRPIHAKPINRLTYEAQETPLYQNVRREGILV